MQKKLSDLQTDSNSLSLSLSVSHSPPLHNLNTRLSPGVLAKRTWHHIQGIGELACRENGKEDREEKTHLLQEIRKVK